ncbi:uncharacterized protein LOC106658696 [Trichogramma pretiosum]|uniref:uncharacterized protein LOC106658696 n=1 Tax=Trichogramma pretiosum TaxID=7493 RepID=UPI0006C97A1D|nr:uncharacterized protein LOC106658696 [Trichogramma pretiosum]XP_014236254.1 uncharacterized protein LOC106658696 [Trichogramma pretiosum]
MVRVIPVHNFQEQNVAQIEEPQASCVASAPHRRELLLLALASHCVEVRDLGQPELPLLTRFPTVDLPTCIMHCVKGNYVVTLEQKQLSPQQSQQHQRSQDCGTYVRVYVNWASQDKQAMRARIAGRVTPSLNRPLNGLEMIELPLSAKATAIACCQTTGNLLVATGNTLILHEFKIETQSPAKMKFIDFEARPWSLGLKFSPTKLDIVEDFIAAMDATRFVVCRLTNPFYDDIDHMSSFTSTTTTTTSSNDKTTVSTDFCSLETVDNSTSGLESNESSLNRLKSQSSLKNCTDKNSNPQSSLDFSKTKIKKKSFIDWNNLFSNEKVELQSLINEGVLENSSSPVTINLPSISLERAGPGHTLNPFVLNSIDTEISIKTNSPSNGWSENYVVRNILRLKIARSSDVMNLDGSSDFFISFVIKPLYTKNDNNSNGIKKSILKSDSYKYLHGVTCLICTTQEGYMYHFNTESSDDNNPTCLTTYPFTAPVIHVALEYTVLHALTEAGLESYTLRLPHHVAKSRPQQQSKKTMCPDVSEPVCLIGLRPFLGVQQMINSDKSIVLLAKAESSWTLYSLRLPRPENVYFDIINAAKNHKANSPSTYRHLLEEAHTILRLSKEILDLHENVNDHFSVDPKLESLYNQSCALLGDYFIRSDKELERRLCIPYYCMSGLKPSEVLLRKSTQDAPGLVTYVIDVLKNIKSGPDADALFQVQDIVNIISLESREDLLKIILTSSVLREYATDKLINLLTLHNSEDDCYNLALTLLYIQAEKQFLADNALNKVLDNFLLKTILDYPHLLFDEEGLDVKNRINLSFSDFSATLIRKKSSVFARILTSLIEEEILLLYQVMQVFLDYLPSRIGRDGQDAAAALQQFLEVYFHSLFSKIENRNGVNYDFTLTEAFKILVRSYLSKLMQTNISKAEELATTNEWQYEDNYLFESRRPKYLDKMPPIAKDYQKIMDASDFEELCQLNISENKKYVRIEVLKLQALMASDFLPNECLQEVEQFLDAEQIQGSLSFRTLCNKNTESITHLLIDKCPQAVLPYAKDMYTRESEWKTLVDLLQQKMSNESSNPDTHLFFEHTMTETIKYIAEVLPAKSLQYIIPKDNDERYQRYTEVCNQIVHAENVKSLLIETGRQLLSSFNS